MVAETPVEKANAALSLLATTLTAAGRAVTEVVSRIRTSFVSPRENYSPVEFIDFGALYRQEDTVSGVVGMVRVRGTGYGVYGMSPG